jgi:hypothetical protein
MEGLLARELVAELEDLTRAVRGLVRLVAYLLEVEVPANESLEMQPEIRERLRAIVRESVSERRR